MQLFLEAFLYQTPVVIITAYQRFNFSKAYFSHSCESNTLKISYVYPTSAMKKVRSHNFHFPSIFTAIVQKPLKSAQKSPKVAFLPTLKPFPDIVERRFPLSFRKM
jgi:hypothetical protein